MACHRCASISECEVKVSPSHLSLSSTGLLDPEETDDEEPTVHSSASNGTSSGSAKAYPFSAGSSPISVKSYSQRNILSDCCRGRNLDLATKKMTPETTNGKLQKSHDRRSSLTHAATHQVHSIMVGQVHCSPPEPQSICNEYRGETREYKAHEQGFHNSATGM